MEIQSDVEAHWSSIDILPRSIHAEFSYADASAWDVFWAGATVPDEAEDCDIPVDTLRLFEGGVLGSYGTDIALDTLCEELCVAIVYYDETNGDLKYAERADDEWSTVTIDDGDDDDVGRYPAIAIDRFGKRHVSYYDATNGVLKYACCPSGCLQAANWLSEVVDDPSEARVGLFTEIAVNQSRVPCISYIDSTHHSVKCAFREAIDWDTVTVEGTPNCLIASTSISVGVQDTIYISYSDRTEKTLKYASCTDDCKYAVSWDTLTVPDSWSDVGLWNSIGVGRGDTVHFSYSASDSACDYKALKYAVRGP